jgi:hypothetical protein
MSPVYPAGLKQAHIWNIELAVQDRIGKTLDTLRVVFLTVIAIALVGFLTVLGMRATGLGSRVVQVGNYVVRLPFGWVVPNLREQYSDIVGQSAEPNNRGLFATDWLGGGIFTMKVLTPADIKAEQESDKKYFKRDHKFPEMPYLMNLPEPNISPITTLQIDGMAFEKVYWSANAHAIFKQIPSGIMLGPTPPPGSKFLSSFEYRSVLGDDKDTIRFEGGSGFGGRSELEQAETIALSLRRKN